MKSGLATNTTVVRPNKLRLQISTRVMGGGIIGRTFMFLRLGRFTVRYRWAIIAAWVAAFVVSLPLLARVTEPLKSGFGEVDTESRRALQIIADRFDSTEAGFTVVFQSDSLPATDARYREEVEKALSPLRDRREVEDVLTYYDGGTPSMVSADGRTTYALVRLELDIDEAIDRISGLKDSLGETELKVWTTGGIPIFSEINDTSEEDLRRGEMLAVPLVLVALVFVFRGVVAAVIPVVVGAVGVSAALALLYFVAQGFDMSIFALNIASFLGLGLAVDYSLLTVSRFREELASRSKDEAVEVAVATSGKTIVFSAVTSILGLASLLLFDFMMLRSLGVGGMLVIAVSMLAALTLLPSILAVVGTRVNALPVLASRKQGRSYWRTLALGVMRRPLLVAIPLLALLVALGIPFLGVKLGSPWASVLPEESPSRQGWEVVEEELGSGELSPVIIVAQFSGDAVGPELLGRMQELVERLERDPRVARVESPLDALSSTGGTPDLTLLRQFARSDTAIVRAYLRHSPVEEEAKDLVSDIRAIDPGPGATLLVSGATADLMDSIDVMYADFPMAVAFVLVTIYVALLVLFRSVFLPLKATIMNMMSIFSSYGALVFIFQEGHLEGLLGFASEGSIEASVPIILFAILFGVSMDYEIFLLSRVKERYDATGDNTRSVAEGLEATGPVITSAALVLVLVALAFATADVIIVKALGVGTAIAVFLDATVVRAFLVPALMRIMDRWNWWAPGWLGRRH
ncbi:MAG: MMPL family transporter [SAR202 cluster bacterium]|nr:MMPL family transporter [SAR202 cluster bacterium]